MSAAAASLSHVFVLYLLIVGDEHKRMVARVQETEGLVR